MNLIKNIYYIVIVLWYIYYIYLMINLYINNSKPYDCEEIVDVKNLDISLEDLSLIIYKKIRPDLLVATIVRLINQRKIKLEKKENDFILIKNCYEKELSKSDNNIIDLLFNIIGNDDSVTLKKINNYCSNNTNCSSFLMFYEIWKKVVFVNSNYSKIFEKKLDYNKVKLIQRLGIILFILNILLKLNLIIGFFIIVPSIFITIYFYNISKLTKEYSDYYYGFLNFRRKIRENKELLENNKYFEYSIILKCYDDVNNVNKKEFTRCLDNAIRKCYTNAFFKGNRSLFKK